nr:unnamed protein product [Callosobruchus chinensis]CAH7738834.1 unnamed protein product [Callosobruchus chinensis]CAH7749802.1 unnamed protein product [Callosobruchus chinensis]CAH7755086.1 unnamed protein product [Callosobruchus chinensis]
MAKNTCQFRKTVKFAQLGPFSLPVEISASCSVVKNSPKKIETYSLQNTGT